jgi:hypothetical protein
MSGAPIPFFGRSFKVELTQNPGALSSGTTTLANSTWGNESLRLTFDTERFVKGDASPYWICDVSIYNLNNPTLAYVVNQGDQLTLSAGYNYGTSPGVSNIIFQGKILQSILERDNVVDSILTIRCIASLLEDRSVYVEVTLNQPWTQADAVRAVAAKANIHVNFLDESLTGKTFPRGRTITESASKYFAEVASDNKLQYVLDWNGLSIKSLTPDSAVPDQVFAPPRITSIPNSQSSTGSTKQTLIGVPQQTQEGITFKVLLDSSIELFQLVKLDMSSARRLLYSPDPNGPIPSINEDGIYSVAGLRHYGDSRGNDWYTEVIGVTRQWAQITGAGKTGTTS